MVKIQKLKKLKTKFLKKYYLLEIEKYIYKQKSEQYNDYSGEADLIDGAVSVGATTTSAFTSGVTTVTSGSASGVTAVTSGSTDFTDRTEFDLITLLVEVWDTDGATDFTESPLGGASPE